MPKKKLSDRDIENELLFEEIPSDTDSCAGGDGSDTEDLLEIEEGPNDSQEITLGESFLPSDEEFDSDDEIPLAQLVQNRQPAAVAVTPSVPAIRPPKWKRAYTILAPDDYTPSVHLPEEISRLAARQQLSPLRIFQLLWTDDVIQHITFHTNLYAEQKGNTYKPVTTDEMSVFIALNLVMGIKKSPSYRDYWSSSPDLRDEYISSFMSLNRFSWILGNLHLNDNNLQPTRNDPHFDKLYKIRPFIEMIREAYKVNYSHTEKIAIDESMIKFKGRSTLKQYMPKKPTKRGYKVWTKCASTGYCLDFEIYTGKIGNKTETNLGGNVVKRFCEGLEDKNHRVYFDNYFNSYELQVDLRLKNVYACGTVNFTRKHLPALKTDRQLKRGQYDYRVSDNQMVSYMKWKDKRSVFILTNFHDPRNKVHVTRTEKTGEKVEVPCPLALKDYNENMNFVDKFDQLKGSYAIDRKSKKWWHRIFFHFLDCTVVNAFIIYKDLQKDPNSCLDELCLKDFRRHVYQDMLAPAYVSNKRRLSRSSSKPNSPTCSFIKKHKPEVPRAIRVSLANHQPVRGTSRRCSVCSTKDMPVRTVWSCRICKVPLCYREGKTCFNDHHEYL